MELSPSQPSHGIAEPANSGPLESISTQQLPVDKTANQIEPLQVVDAGQDAEIDYPTGIKFALVVLALGLVLVLVGLDSNIVATAIPSITNDFKTIADVGWYSSAFRLTACSFQFMFGKMYTVFSVKRVFLFALAIFEFGSLLCGVAPTSTAFVVGRAVCGLGCAGIISGVFTLVTQSVPLRRRAIFGGIGGGIEGISSVCSPLLGGLLTDTISWRMCFFINLPMGFITFIIVAVWFQNPQLGAYCSLGLKEKIKMLDLVSTAVFVPSITCLLLALQWAGSKYGWGNARIVVLLVLFVLLAGVFAYLQYRRGDMATLPMRIIKQRSILAGFWFSMCNNSAISVTDYYLPIYFQAVRQTSAAKSGVMILPTLISFTFSLVIAGPGVSLVGFYAPFMLATSLLMPIGAGLLTTLKVDATLSSLIAYQVLLGFACGIGFQGTQVAAQTILSPADAPMGIAVIIFAQNFGPAVLVPLAQLIFTTQLEKNLGQLGGNTGLNATNVESMGLSNLKADVPASLLPAVLQQYDKALTQTFYLPVALTCLTMLGSLAMEWRSVKAKRS